MSEPFLAEIIIFGGNFAPRGWATCDGQTLPIAQNTALFALLGVTYGGNGQTTFGLPNLQGAAPICFNQGPGLSPYSLGQTGGSTSVTLLANQMPAHTHTPQSVDNSGNQSAPSGTTTWAQAKIGKAGTPLYSNNAGNSPKMNAQLLPVIGNSQPHNNMPPYLTLLYIIAMQGVFPVRN